MAVITTQTARRFEIWSAPECDGGQRVAVLTNVSQAIATESLGADGSFRLEVPLPEPQAGAVLAHRILRVDEDDTSFDEWRIDDFTRDASAGMVALSAAPLYTLLGKRALVEQLDGLGGRRYNFDIIGMAPSAIIDAYVLPALSVAGLAWVDRGTIDNDAPINLSADWDSPWSLLRKIEAVTGLELDLERDGTSGYNITLVDEIGSAADISDVRFAKNLIGSAFRNSTDRQATRVFPRGAAVDGFNATMARAVWRVASVAGVDVFLEDPAGGDPPFAFDHQLDGYYLLKPSGALEEVLNTYAGGTQAVALGSTAGIVAGDLVQFRENAAGDDLTWLDSPTDIARDDFVVGTLDEPDVPATNNVIPNAAERTWPATLPTGWTAVGAPTTSKETTAPLWQSASQSIKVIAAAAGLGVLSPAGKVRPTAASPYGSAFANIRVTSGQVRMELVVTTGAGAVVYPGTPAVASSSTHDAWESLGVSGIDMNAIGATAVAVRIVSHGGAATFYVDAAQHTETAAQEPFIEGSGGTKLWQAANERLRLYGTPVAEHRITLADLARIDPDTWDGDCTLVLGGRIQIYDPQTLLTQYSTRIVTLERDYLVEGNTAITLSTRPEDLAGMLAKARKAERLPQPTVSDYPIYSLGPSLDVVSTPGPASYSIAYTASAGTVQLSINGAAYSTAPASPISVTRPAIGADPLEYAFRLNDGTQTVTDLVTIQPLDKDTVTPALSVVQSTPTTTDIRLTPTATNPSGGAAPTLTVTLVGLSAVILGVTQPPGTYTITSGTDVTAIRPAFGTTAQASVSFTASISGGGAESIMRTVANQVKTSFGPSLDVTATPGGSSYSIAYTAGSGTVELSIDGAAYGTAPASPIVVTRPAAGAASKDYAFRLTVDGQTITNSVTVPSIDKDTVTPNLTVTPSAPTATTQDFSVSATNAGGGAAPDIYAIIRGSTGVYGAGTPMADGTEYLVSSGGGTVVVTPNRPAFGTTAQASVSFRAVVSGGGQETIQRSLLTQVKTTFGPSLDVVATPGGSSYSIAYTGTGTVMLSIDGAGYSAAAASPIVVTRPAAGVNSKTYTFQATADGQTATEAILVPAVDKDTVTPDIAVVPGADATTTKPFTVTASNPSGGSAPTITVTPINCTMVIAGTPYTTVQTVASGTVVTAQRPAFDNTIQASLTFTATLSGGGSATIQRTVLNQVKTTFGPSLVATPTGDATSVSIDYTATGTVELSIDGGTYSSAPSSPIVVTRNAPGGARQTYTLKASADGQEISTTVQIDPEDGGAFTAPSITNVQCYNSFYPNDGGGSFDVSWDANNLPGGCTFDLSCNITAGYFGGPNPVTRSGITSPATISNPPGPGPEFSSLPSGNVTITAKLDGTVICVGVFSGTFS